MKHYIAIHTQTTIRLFHDYFVQDTSVAENRENAIRTNEDEEGFSVNKVKLMNSDIQLMHNG